MDKTVKVINVRQYYEFEKWWLEHLAYHGGIKLTTHQSFPGWSEAEVVLVRGQLEAAAAIGDFCCI